MSVGGTRQNQPKPIHHHTAAHKPAHTSATHGTQHTSAAHGTQQASAPKNTQQTAAPKSDFFKDLSKNVFDAIKKAAPQLKGLGQKLINDPGVKAALGTKDPSQILGAAKDAGKEIAKQFVNDKIVNSEWLQNQPKFEKSFEKGKALPEGTSSKDFVNNGLAGNVLNQGIKNTKTGSKDITLGSGAQTAVNKGFDGLGKAQDLLGKGKQIEDLANKFGIQIPKFERSAETSNTKNLYTSKDGKGTVDMGTSASGKVSAGISGITAEGQAKIGVTAQRTDGGKIEGKYGTAEGQYTAKAGAEASVNGNAKLDANGLEINAGAKVGVSASLEASGKVESKPLATIGGVPITAHAEATGKVEVGASAEATGSAKFTGHPPTAVVEGHAGAFAGARASIEGKAGIGPIGVKGGAEGWAGVGATADFHAGYKDGHLKLDFGVGAALGIGGKLSGGLDIDVGGLAKIATGVIDDAGKIAHNVEKGVSDAVHTVEKGVSDAVHNVEKGVSDAVHNVEKGVSNVVSNVSHAVTNVVSNVGSSISNFAKKLHIF